MAKFKFHEIHNTLLGSVLIKSALEVDKNIRKVFGTPLPEEWDIQFIVNGVELPIKETFDKIAERDEERIKNAARKLIHEEFFGLDELLLNIQKTIKDAVFEKFGIEIEIED